jgi:mRNA-degrading endonuclease toxin of MazEF toxin-antitoxin module
MKVQQRDIVELNYELPNGKFKAHPALVISNSNVLETEDIFYAVMISSNPMNEEFNFELDNSMLTKPLSKKSFIKCQLIQSYSTDEVISRISSLNQIMFDKVLKKIFETVFKSV